MKFTITSNVMTLLPSMFTNFELVKRDLRYFGFKINDETNEIEDPKKKISLPMKKIRYIDKFYNVIWDFDQAEMEFRLK